MSRILGIIILSFSLLWAAVPPKLPVTSLLGKTYIDVIRSNGFPNSIFPVRQSVPEKDDVVFVYADGFYYFWSNHMYRVLFSSSYQDEILPGLKIGDDKSALTKQFGQKYTLEKDGLLWTQDKFLVLAKMDEKNKLQDLWFITKVEK